MVGQRVEGTQQNQPSRVKEADSVRKKSETGKGKQMNGAPSRLHSDRKRNSRRIKEANRILLRCGEEQGREKENKMA